MRQFLVKITILCASGKIRDKNIIGVFYAHCRTKASTIDYLPQPCTVHIRFLISLSIRLSVFPYI